MNRLAEAHELSGWFRTHMVPTSYNIFWTAFEFYFRMLTHNKNRARGRGPGLGLGPCAPWPQSRVAPHWPWAMSDERWAMSHEPSSMHQASSKHQASSIKHQTSSIKHRASTITHQPSSIKHQTSSETKQVRQRTLSFCSFHESRKRRIRNAFV